MILRHDCHVDTGVRKDESRVRVLLGHLASALRGAGRTLRTRWAAVLITTLGVVVPLTASAQTTNPTNPHGPLPAGLDCVACHTSEGWNPLKATIDFDHNRQTAFALTGAHRDATCGTCHLRARFDQPKVETTGCASCHVDVHRGNKSETCTACHNTITFLDVAGVSVHAQTMFPLTGAHVQLSCESCHVDDRGGAFSTMDSDCYSCHEKDYNATQSLDHVQLAFSKKCEDCHNTLAWGGSGVFNHVAVSSGFELLGAHARARCEACHVVPGLEPIFPGVKQGDCVGCHQPDYDAKHGGGFPTECATCHSLEAWAPATFDHTATSGGFELLGAHSLATCESCHVVPGFASLYTTSDQNDCVGCHQSDHDAQHGAGFPTDCASCHTVNAWTGATFDHVTASSGFDLLGAHATAPCASCHVIPGYTPIFSTTNQNDCVGCHQSDHDAQHGAGFPTDCASCHNVNTWVGATFDHVTASSGFELLGAHATAPCVSCHVIPGYAPLFTAANQNDCISCHQSDYDAQHSGTGFSTDCRTCHSTDTWLGATFDHDAQFFPIYSGKHAGRWSNDCTTCHNVPGNYQQYTCFNCHKHDKGPTDDQHSQVAGYAYESTACVSCHPRGTH